MSEVRENRRICRINWAMVRYNRGDSDKLGMICEEMPELHSLMLSAFSVGLSLGAAKR